MRRELRFGPLIGPSFLLGLGMGGMLEGIFLRQVLGLHMMLSEKVPLKSGAAFRQSLIWDGLLQAGLWILVLTGVIFLFRAAKEEDVPWSGQSVAGGWLLGWGAYTLVEGLLSHHLFRWHRLFQGASLSTQDTADWAYLGLGAALAGLGFWMVSSVRSELEEALHWKAREAERKKELIGDRKVYLD